MENCQEAATLTGCRINRMLQILRNDNGLISSIVGIHIVYWQHVNNVQKLSYTVHQMYYICSVVSNQNKTNMEICNIHAMQRNLSSSYVQGSVEEWSKSTAHPIQCLFNVLYFVCTQPYCSWCKHSLAAGSYISVVDVLLSFQSVQP